MKKIRTIVKKEWAEVFRNKLVLFTVAFLPLILTAIPLVILGSMGADPDLSSATAALPSQFEALCPDGLTGGECFQVYMVNQFMVMFMILPLAIPATIASYSIVGEKTTRSLEPLLATPITTTELLVGKSLSALLPAVLATYGAFLIFAIGSAIMVRNPILLTALLDIRWLLAISILGPLMALMAVSVSVMVSSRVNDPRVAEQISMVVIIPVLLIFFGQLAGVIVLNQNVVLIGVAVMLVVDFFLIRFAVQTFQRETILTRWK
jgi:ABC-2 type transport system permease protein